MKAIVIILLFLIGCSKSTIEPEKSFKLLYIDNLGKCIPCIQMKKISEDVINERFKLVKDSLNLSYERVPVRGERYKDLKTKTNVIPKALILVSIEDGVEVDYSIINTGLMFLSLDKPEYCKKLIEQKILEILNTKVN